MHISSLLATLAVRAAAVQVSASIHLDSRAPAVAGESRVIPSWYIQRLSLAGARDAAELSKPGVADTSSWVHVNKSKCTLMGCLIDAGKYNDTDLFYSTNLAKFDASQFAEPWVYLSSFKAPNTGTSRYWLETGGITSRADIFVNGQQVANSAYQAGAYGGRKYDISNATRADGNTLVIKVYPTDYNYDFAIGFVDWNPYPPDNGTGVWRDVWVRETGPVVLDPLRVVPNMPGKCGKAKVTFKTTARNVEGVAVKALVETQVEHVGQGPRGGGSQNFTLGPYETQDITMEVSVRDAKLWWPKAWGDQDLYRATLAISLTSEGWNGTRRQGEVSDRAQKQFGFRNVTSTLNAQGDRLFSVNGRPFQVLGGGYTSDMFLRWDAARFTTEALYSLDMGLNTIRLEGKMEHPELYEIADRLGLFVMPGWECCDKWEAWTYNDNNVINDVWDAQDYDVAEASMRHEALMMQSHPSVLAFLVGSDFWPNDEATKRYLDALNYAEWQTPIVSSASTKDGFPKAIGPGGMKMLGPYDWVPPNYWYDTEPSSDRLGAAFGFGSELGAGVGTPELSSLKRFLSQQDLDDLWKQPKKGLYHMSTSVSSFYTRTIYNNALWSRYDAPTSLEDYLVKAQISDYEATRAEFEAFSAKWNAKRPATGLIYWMLNSAWPNLHWTLWDYYLQPAGSYFGAKVGSRLEHVAYDYVKKDVYLINHSIQDKGARVLHVQVVAVNGTTLYNTTLTVQTEPNTSKTVLNLGSALGSMREVVFLRLQLSPAGTWPPWPYSRNVYWLSPTVDALDWARSDWFYTPVSRYASFTSLDQLPPANVTAELTPFPVRLGQRATVRLQNHSPHPAFFLRLTMLDRRGVEITPITWTDNYVTLMPGERLEVDANFELGAVPEPVDVKLLPRLRIKGKNVAETEVHFGSI